MSKRISQEDSLNSKDSKDSNASDDQPHLDHANHSYRITPRLMTGLSMVLWLTGGFLTYATYFNPDIGFHDKTLAMGVLIAGTILFIAGLASARYCRKADNGITQAAISHRSEANFIEDQSEASIKEDDSNKKYCRLE